MAYTEPTAESFKTRYPEFSVVADPLIELLIEEAIELVGDCWLEKDRAKGQTLWIAHTLSMEGEPARSKAIAEGSSPSSAQSGPISSMKVGDVSITYKGRSDSGNSGSGTAANEYSKTPYGAQFYVLLRKNFPAIRAV